MIVHYITNLKKKKEKWKFCLCSFVPFTEVKCVYVSGRAYVCLKGAITVAHYLPAVGLSAALLISVGNMYVPAMI